MWGVLVDIFGRPLTDDCMVLPIENSTWVTLSADRTVAVRHEESVWLTTHLSNRIPSVKRGYVWVKVNLNHDSIANVKVNRDSISRSLLLNHPSTQAISFTYPPDRASTIMPHAKVIYTSHDQSLSLVNCIILDDINQVTSVDRFCQYVDQLRLLYN